MRKFNILLLLGLLFSWNLFADAVSVATIASDRTATGPATSVALGGIYRTYFAFGSTTSGSGACAVKVQASNDNISFVDLATISLTLGTSVVSDGFASAAPWKYARANVDSISGTGAKCSLLVGGTGK